MITIILTPLENLLRTHRFILIKHLQFRAALMVVAAPKGPASLFELRTRGNGGSAAHNAFSRSAELLGLARELDGFNIGTGDAYTAAELIKTRQRSC